VRGSGIFADGARFAIDKDPCIGGIFQDLQDGGNAGLLPGHVAEAVATGQAEIVRLEELQHLTG
jgi:hypothetical protein